MAALFAAAGAGLAASEAARQKVQPALVGAAAVAGGLSAFALWRFTPSLSKVQTPDGAERWAERFGEPSDALRMAARANGKDLQELRTACRRSKLSAAATERAVKLLLRDLPEEDKEMQTLVDATSLDFFEKELQRQKLDDPNVRVMLAEKWVKMSSQAQKLALSLDYDLDGTALCLLLEAAASQAPQAPVVAAVPTLLHSCVLDLQKSWEEANAASETLSSELCEMIGAEHPELKDVCSCPLVKDSRKIHAIISYLLRLVASQNTVVFRRLVHAIASCAHLAGFRLLHLAAVKRSLVRTITNHTKEKKVAQRAWEAFFYTFGAVAAPYLVTQDRMEETAAATASSLPTPGGGPHAAIAALNGAALLEMCLKITAVSGGTAAPDAVFGLLRDVRISFVQCVRDDANVYCGFLGTVYACESEQDPERMLWLKRAAEVPISVAELAIKTGTECLHCKHLIKPSLKGDWIAGSKLLRTALEISLKNVAINLRTLGTTRYADISQRLAKIREYEPPWDDLVDVMA